MNQNLLSIVIPAYNEEKTISLLLDKVSEIELIGGIEKEIIIVNDCSKDQTAIVIEQFKKTKPELNIRLFHQPVNMGKGAAIHRGMPKVTCAHLLFKEADVEHDPREYNDLLKLRMEGFADVVFGSRFSGGNPHRILFFWHSIGNKLLTFVSNMFSNLNLTDMETCYKLFKSEIIKSISLKENRFGFEPEVTAKISRIPNIRIYEVGVSYYGRTYAEGKKINWKDGLRAFYVIVKYNVWAKK